MKKQIDFDFAKWGQEGISVEYNRKTILTLHINPFNNEYYYGIINENLAFIAPATPLTMFEEVKPREFWAQYIIADLTDKANEATELFEIEALKLEAQRLGLEIDFDSIWDESVKQFVQLQRDQLYFNTFGI